MRKNLNYEKDLRIDENALDLEFLDQASLAMRYGENLADAEKELFYAKERLAVKEADLTKRANSKPDTLLGAGVKPTGDNVKSFVKMHKEYRELQEELIEAQYEYNMAKIAYDEISRTRKTALENLVKLHGQNYFAGPKVPRDLHKERVDADTERKFNNKKIQIKRRRSVDDDE